MGEQLDELRRAYRGAPEGMARLEAAAALAVALAELGGTVPAARYAGVAEHEAEGVDDPRGKAIALRAVGVVAFWDEDFLAAVSVLGRAREHAAGIKDLVVRAKILTEMARAEHMLGQQVRSIDLLFEALDVSGKVDDPEAEADIYRGFVRIYNRLQDFENATKFADAAVALARTHHLTRPLGEALLLRGNVAAHRQERLFYAGQPGDEAAGREALHWYRQARPIARELGDRTIELGLVNNTARVMLYMGRPAEATRLFSTYLDRVGDDLRPGAVAMLRFGLGEATMAEDPARGLPILRDAVRLAQKHRSMNHLPKMYLSLANAYERMGDTARALAHHKAYHEVEGLVFGEAARRRAALAAVEIEADSIRFESDRLREVGVDLEERLTALRVHNESLDDQIRRDPLTGLPNRRAFDECLARLGTEPVSVALLDIDRFKSINDTYSHRVGDEVLRRVARIVADAVRYGDLAARYGGEEFGLVLPDTLLDQAVVVCERVRLAVADADWTGVCRDLRVTVSAGVARDAVPEPALRIADARLYAAKGAGRNQVVAG